MELNFLAKCDSTKRLIVQLQPRAQELLAEFLKPCLRPKSHTAKGHKE